MNAAIYKQVESIIEGEARAWARAWPSVSLDDFRQEAWVTALDAASRYDAELGSLKALCRGALKRRMLNYAYQTAAPVHFPKNNEHKFARHVHKSSGHVIDNDPDCGLRHDELVEREIRIAQVREAVEVVTSQHPELRGALLSDERRGPKWLVDNFGGTKSQWQRRLKMARDQLREVLSCIS
jgi:hypothetical protein